MHTAQHIVEHCLRGDLAKNRTIILVTHHITLCLSSASYIVELAAGKVVLQGSVKELQATGNLKTVVDAEDDTAEPEGEEEEIVSINEADAVTQNGGEEKRKRISSGKLVEAEHREEGRVSLATYITYGAPFILISFQTIGLISDSKKRWHSCLDPHRDSCRHDVAHHNWQ